MAVKLQVPMQTEVRYGWERKKGMSAIPDNYGLTQALSNISYMSISTVQLKKIVYFLGRGNYNSIFKSEPLNLGSFLPGHQQASYQLHVGF